VDGVETSIIPTNVFMRGIVIPPGASKVRLEFVPFSLSRGAVPLYAGGLALLIASLAAVAYLRRRVGALPRVEGTQ
jgi:hypothetical protein